MEASKDGFEASKGGLEVSKGGLEASKGDFEAFQGWFLEASKVVWKPSKDGFWKLQR